MILWENPNQRLIRAKKSWGYGNYILEITDPFKTLICGLTIEECLNRFREANSEYWKTAKSTEPIKRKKKRK